MLSFCCFGDIHSGEKAAMDKGTSLAIRQAIFDNDHDAVKRLLKQHPEAVQGSVAGRNWMGMAAASGNLDLVKLLFELGVNVNGPNPKMGGPLWHAVKGGHEEVAKWLLVHGANPNQFDVLGTAAMKGNLSMVKLLMQRGADLHARWGGKSGQDFNALAMAEVYGHKDVAEYLRKQGAVSPDQPVPAKKPER